MNKLRFKVFLFVSFILILNVRAQINVIPQPKYVQPGSGFFKLNENTNIFYSQQDGMEQNALYLQSLLAKPTSFAFIVSEWDGITKSDCIILNSIDPEADSLGSEGYYLNVYSDHISINGSTAAGIFYGIQTLRQLLPSAIESPQITNYVDWNVPCINIADKPAFVWRGLLLDCCRHFMTKDFILRYIDLLAYYKMNRFHWHLTEDQGWRIEINKYPKLTSVGAWRKEPDGKTYGGFYTQDDIREVVSYAASRHVMVIPEIEMPGHSVAALASYPDYSCNRTPLKVENSWGVFKDIYCAGNDSTFRFLEFVLNEVIQLFPSSYIHIGGDEAPKYRWDNCKKCQERMKKIGAKDVGELQSYFIKRIETYLKSKNRKIIGWDEILEGGLAPDATVQSWRGYDGALAAARSGHDAIVSPTSYAYFDYSVRTTPIDKVYDFDPVPDSLEPQFRKHILGGECNMWTEYAPQELVDSKVFPRILAMAEVLWSDPVKRNKDAFLLRVQQQYPRLDFLGVKYGYERQPVSFSTGFNEQDKSFLVSLIAGQKNLELYYSTDGSVPSLKSTQYKGPFVLRNTTDLKVRVLRNNNLETDVYTQSLIKHLGIGKSISLINPYSENYPAAGKNALLDGIRGSKDYRDGQWQGYHKSDMDAIIWLGDKVTLTKITIGFLQSIPSWIFFPEYINLSVSDNGKDFKPVSMLSQVDLPQDDVTRVQDFVFTNFGQLEARYIRIRAKNIGYCPEWHDAAGGEAWLFLDEIILE